jgi:hypothetical protein
MKLNIMSDVIREKFQDKAMDLEVQLRRLLIDLAHRENNYYNITGLGGDIRKMVYLLINDLSLINSEFDVESKSKAGFFIENNKVVFKSDPINPYYRYTVKEVRDLLDKFIIDNNIELPNITEQLFIDYDYMKQFQGKSFQLDLYLKCLSYTLSLKENLLNKKDIIDLVKKNFSKEYDDMFNSFVKELGLQCQDINPLAIAGMMSNHPNYVGKSQELQDRKYKTIQSITYGFSEKKDIELINAMPKYISMICYRLVIGIEMIVKYNLDEFAPNYEE